MEYDGVSDHQFAPSKILVIDGKQRLNAYIEFIQGKFALPSGHYFVDMSDQCKKLIWGFGTISDCATVYFGDRISDEDKISWFAQINFSGTPQDEAHMKMLESL